MWFKRQDCKPQTDPVVDPEDIGFKFNLLRWNLVFNLIIWLLVPLPLWLPYVWFSPIWTKFLLVGVQLLLLLGWLTVSLLAVVTYIRLYRSRDQTWSDHGIPHLVLISVYKEPLEVLMETVRSLADQTQVHRVHLNIGFEERTPELERKRERLREEFGETFQRLSFTVHKDGIAGEIPGKCSNVNFGMMQTMADLEKEGVDIDNVLVTNCDVDNKFHPKYLESLSGTFAKTKDPHSCLYQSPLLYNWGLDASSFITRVTGIVRAGLMMGALIPFNINTMSCYSFSGKLAKMGNYGHPGYQMEDIMCLIRWMGVAGKKLRIVLVPVPTLSGPTSGRVVEEDVQEWARQARRWTIGAAEVFHYFMAKTKNIPLITCLNWGSTFLTYYGVFLCSSSLYSVSLLFSLIYILPPVSPYINGSLLMLQYLPMGIMFLLDWRAPLLMDPQPKEHISLLRNFLHFFLSPLVLLSYSVVEFVALHELALRGRAVCSHKASKKETLSAVVTS